MKNKILISLILLLFILCPLLKSDISIASYHVKPNTKTIYVDDDFDDDPLNHKWNTIQEGVNDANDGDIIYVYSGIYYENILVEKLVTIIGEDKDYTIIDGQQKGDSIHIKNDYVVLTNFTIKNSGFEVYPDPEAAIDIQSSNVTITHCNIISNNYGILIKKSDTLVENCYLSKCVRGFHIRGDANNITNCLIVNNTIGVFGEQVKKNILLKLDVHQNENGIHFVNSWNNSLFSSILTNNTQNGIILEWTCFDNMISDCEISGNGEDGIHIYASTDRNIITKCHISSNGGDGIEFFDTANNNIVLYSNITNNAQRGIYSHWMYIPPFNRIHFCNIFNNNFGIFGELCQPIATHNWWGSVDGPSGYGNGQGDKITDNVVYTPWLQNPPLANSPPIITIVSPAEGEVVRGDIIISGDSNDPDGIENIGIVELKIDNGNWIVVDKISNWEYHNLPTLNNGYHILSARAYDYIDYSQIFRRNIIVDNDNPIINLYYPTGGEQTKNSINISWSANDNQDDNLSISISYSNGSTWHHIFSTETIKKEYNWNISTIPDGKYFINITAIDNAGNQASDFSEWFTIDNTLPAFQILKPLIGYLYIRDTKIVPTLGGKTVVCGKLTITTLVDAILGVKQIEFYIDGGQENILYTPPYEWLINRPLLGNYIIDIFLYDTANRSAHKSFEALFFSW